MFLARRRAGYSQEELGKRCSLHPTEIGMIESGDRLPRSDTLMKLAGGLEVGAELLLRGIESHRFQPISISRKPLETALHVAQQVHRIGLISGLSVWNPKVANRAISGCCLKIGADP